MTLMYVELGHQWQKCILDYLQITIGETRIEQSSLVTLNRNFTPWVRRICAHRHSISESGTNVGESILCGALCSSAVYEPSSDWRSKWIQCYKLHCKICEKLKISSQNFDLHSPVCIFVICPNSTLHKHWKCNKKVLTCKILTISFMAEYSHHSRSHTCPTSMLWVWLHSSSFHSPTLN